MPEAARAVAIGGKLKINVLSSGPPWWGEHKLVVKLITGRGGGGGPGSDEASDLGPRAHHRTGVSVVPVFKSHNSDRIKVVHRGKRVLLCCVSRNPSVGWIGSTTVTHIKVSARAQ